MKFATFQFRENISVGAVLNSGAEIVDLTASGITTDMVDLIEHFGDRVDQISRAVEAKSNVVSISDVALLAPIPTPLRNVFCVGKNYHDHAAEFGKSGFDSSSNGSNAAPEYPIIFSKPPSCIIGPNASIIAANDLYNSVDYEGELAVVLGRNGRVCDEDDPLTFVFGYTILNDVTSRELQKGINNGCWARASTHSAQWDHSS